MMTAALHRRHGRTVPILLVLVLLVAWLPTSAAWGDARDISEDLCLAPYTSDFDDIVGSAHEEMIRCMADHGLTEGVGDGSSYAPRRDVTRGQMASFVARFLEAYTGAPLPDGDAQRFDDVPADDATYPHATNIHSLAEIEVVEGTLASGGDAYAPQNGVTRAQMASMIRRALAWADDGDARNDSAPPAGEQGAFPDTEGSVHEDNVDAIAAVGIVQGFDDDTYRPGDRVKRDQMASFVMRSYDYALTEGLTGEPDPEPQATIVSPTSGAPMYPIPAAGEFEIVFETGVAGDYELELRDPDEEEETFLGLPIPGGDDEDDEGWREFDGADASGSVDGAGPHEVTVTVPDDEEIGARDIRLTFTPDGADEDDALTDVQEASLLVADGLVINEEQGELYLDDLQGAVDEADDGDTLLAVGAFEEEPLVVEEVADLTLSGMPATISPHGEDTTLAGSIEVDGVEGLTLSDLVISGYDAFDGTPLGIIDAGTAIGVMVREGSDGLQLTRLTLEGDEEQDDDIGVVVGGEIAGATITGSTFRGNHQGALIDGEVTDVTVGGSTFEGDEDSTSDVGLWIEEDVVGAEVTGNTFRHFHWALRIAGEDVDVHEGNLFEDNRNGAFVESSATGVEVVGNDFLDNEDGFQSDAPGVLIEDNEFDGHANWAIRIISGAPDVDIVGNGFGDNDHHVELHQDDYGLGDGDDIIDTNEFDDPAEAIEDGDWIVVLPE